MTIGVYKWTNKINNKIYIGQSINIEARKKAHLKSKKGKSNCILHKAFKKYGIENFEFEIIAQNIPIQFLNLWETFYIKVFNCVQPNGYNIHPEGGSPRGYKWTNEQKEKLKNIKKDKPNPFAGKKHSDETKTHWSKIRKGQPSYNKGLILGPMKKSICFCCKREFSINVLKRYHNENCKDYPGEVQLQADLVGFDFLGTIFSAPKRYSADQCML